MLKKVMQGETVKKYVRVNDKVVERQHVTEHGKLGNVLLKWSFDFDGVSNDAILELASRAVLIGSRPKFKKTSPQEAEQYAEKTISVALFLERERAKLSPQEKAARIMSELPTEEAIKMLEEYIKKGEAEELTAQAINE